MIFKTTLDKLKEGNARFIRGETATPKRTPDARIKASEAPQRPLAAVVACSDSRKAVEIILDAGLGELFIVRQAGNVIATNEAGSIEFATTALETPLCIVMGHSLCGAITGVVEGVSLPKNTAKLVEPIKVAVEITKKENPNANSTELAEKAIYTNIWESIKNLFLLSDVIKEKVKNNELKVIGAIYDIKSGKVEFLGEHKDQANLL